MPTQAECTNGLTPLALARTGGHVEIIELLEATISMIKYMPPVLMACFNKDLETESFWKPGPM